MIRFFVTDNGLMINLISTLNDNEIPPLVLSLGDMPQRVPISMIEKKLNGLRTLYAIFYLIHNDREEELQSYIIKHPNGDIERALLNDDEQLFIESISYGSWLLTVWTKSKKAFKALNSVVGLVFERGREAYLSKLEAESRLTNALASKEEVAVAREKFNLYRDQTDYLLEVSDKLKIPEVKEQIKKRMIQASKDFLSGDRADSMNKLMKD